MDKIGRELIQEETAHLPRETRVHVRSAPNQTCHASLPPLLPHPFK